jgi:SAM-dependent methyltransferase
MSNLEPGAALPAALFQRQDNSPDSQFYLQPRMVTHIDEATINALTEFYEEFLPKDSDLLDLMSSWVSHLPADTPYNSVTGHGMNAEELAANPRLTDSLVQDLNADSVLPFADASFDRATIVVSIQYLIEPVAVMQELLRVLRPGGQLCIAMSHRCFPTKAILAFHQLSAQDRVALVEEYLLRAGFVDIGFIDRSPAAADPLWLVVGSKPER